jgi:hypothetical protein
MQAQDCSLTNTAFVFRVSVLNFSESMPRLHVLQLLMIPNELISYRALLQISE